jgi:hypothetical protein
MTTWTLSGQVTDTTGGNVIGATVAILDGANSGKSATADGTGRYSLSGLTPGGFSVRASAPGYVASTVPVTLLANTTTNFSLVHVPLAALSYSGSLTFEPVRPDGSYWLHGTITNTGSGCAQNASGVITIVDSTKTVTLSYPWHLDSALILRPGAAVQYECLTSLADIAKRGTAPGGTYDGTTTFVSVSCS